MERKGRLAPVTHPPTALSPSLALGKGFAEVATGEHECKTGAQGWRCGVESGRMNVAASHNTRDLAPGRGEVSDVLGPTTHLSEAPPLSGCRARLQTVELGRWDCSPEQHPPCTFPQ